MEEERLPMYSFVKALLCSIATACISVYRCLLAPLAARVLPSNLFQYINQTTAISSSDSELLIKQPGQRDKDVTLHAEREKVLDGGEIITLPSDDATTTEGSKDDHLDSTGSIPSVIMEAAAAEGGASASHTEVPTLITVVQLDINQTTIVSSDPESLVKQQGQRDKDDTLDAERREEESDGGEIITILPSDDATTTEGSKDDHLDSTGNIPSVAMEAAEAAADEEVEEAEAEGGASASSHTEAAPTLTVDMMWSPQEIPYHVLASATNNFSEEMMLGKGGFGPVYRGFLTDLAMDVAVKRLSERSQQGLSEYMAEIKIITQVRHRNLVKLIGWCHERSELLLVYEFMPNGSLDDHLFKDMSNNLQHLDWTVRYKIAVGLANALTYLHDDCDPFVLHRDVKSSNVLLDSKFDAKLADFGLARHFSLDDSSVRVSCAAGTRGYWAPEYALMCKASTRSDIYSFGVVALEIACGKKAILVMERESDPRLLVEWVWELYGKGSILVAADKRLNGSFDRLQMERLLMVGLWCAQPDHRNRPPSMRQAGNALLFPETTRLPDLPKTVVSWAHPVASMRMQTVQLSSNMPASSPTLSAMSDDLINKSLISSPGDYENNYQLINTNSPKPKTVHVIKPKRSWLFNNVPHFTRWTRRSRTRNGDVVLCDDPELKKLAVELSTLRVATDNFSSRNLLGWSKFSAVYKGRLPDGELVAVKRYRSDDGELGYWGNESLLEYWRNEVLRLSNLQLRNLVGLLGFCVEGKERLLVYEYASNSNLHKLLFGMRDTQEISTVESLLMDLATLRAATGNFSDQNKLGQGGFGSVYKGLLPNGHDIAVKRLRTDAEQGVDELKNEVVLVAKFQHRNLVRLLGLCLEGEEKLLVYEYVINSSVDKFLFDPTRSQQLNWERRYKIVGGVARGLQYLHEDSQVKIIHRDLKASNILLDVEMNPKISDFGMATFFDGDQTQASTILVVGTYGYMAPEYAMSGRFSNKSDVFSFGVLVLEILTGQRNSTFSDSVGSTDLLSYVWAHWTNGTVLEMIDPSLGGQYQRGEVMRCAHIGLLCVQEAAADRPTMATVLLMLSAHSVSLQVPSKPAFFAGYSQEYLDVLKRSSDHSSPSTMSEALKSPYSLNDASITELDPR